MSKSPVTDPRVVSAYAKLAAGTRKAEESFIVTHAEKLSAGSLSVKVLRDSIKVASESGNAPTVRPSHAQDMARAAFIIANAKDVQAVPLRAVLTMATRLRKGCEGAEAGDAMAADLVASGVPFTEWDGIVPATNVKEDGKEDGEGGKVTGAKSVDDVIRAALEALGQIEDATLSDVEAAAALIRKVQAYVKIAKAGA